METLEAKIERHLYFEQNYRRYAREDEAVLCKWETDIEDLVASIVSKKEDIVRCQNIADKHSRKANKLKHKLEDSSNE